VILNITGYIVSCEFKFNVGKLFLVN